MNRLVVGFLIALTSTLAASCTSSSDKAADTGTPPKPDDDDAGDAVDSAAADGGSVSGDEDDASVPVADASTDDIDAAAADGGAANSDPCARVDASGRGNLIENGSFETPAVPVGSYTLFTTGASIGEWSVVGASGNVAPLGKGFASMGLLFPSHAGDQTLDLTGLSNTATGVAQAVKTKARTSYTLSFWSGNINDPGGIYGTSSAVSVLIDGKLVLTTKNDAGKGTKTLGWKRYCVVLRAKSASTKIELRNADSSSDDSNIVDDVMLQ